MLNRIVLFVALLAPATALAADQAAVDEADGSEKSICDQIGPDPDKCAQAWRYCHWDARDGRCENNVPVSGCYSIFDPHACNATFGCVWDEEDPLGARCEPTG
ncbi:hypothetical protein [Sorangium sp. So ce385]|uniref:hypothetical protein n=1 Tax=Sorangium sp. So ce385 TaxID=3133308 RepID=UPI003F5C27A8